MLKKLLPFTLFLIIIALFFTGLKSTWLFTADDSYITLRYAQHFAEGYGIVWNIGQPPLEGYSNFSYLLLGSLFYYFHFSTSVVIEMIRGFSLLSLILTGVMMYRTMRLWVSPALSLLPIIFILSYHGTLLWSFSGLETPFFMLLIVSAVYCLLRNRYGLAGLIMAIAGLTRPEAPLFFIVFGIILAATTLKKFGFRPILYYILAFTVLYLPYFLWRIYYFGHLFPNPVYCKFLNSKRPFAFVYEYFKIAAPLLALSLPAYFMKKPHNFLYYFIMPTFACLFMLYFTDPIVGIFNRYSLPFLTLISMNSVLGLQQLMMHIPLKFRKEYYTCLLYLIICFFLTSEISFKMNDMMADSYYLKTKMRIALAQWIEQRIQEGNEKTDTSTAQPISIVVGDCGLVPLLLNHTDVVDSLCLNSREMTSPAIQQSYPKFVNWILQTKKPTYIIFASYKLHQIMMDYPFDKAMIQDQRFQKNYYPVKKISLNYSYIPYYYTIYQKKQENTHDPITSSSSK